MNFQQAIGYRCDNEQHESNQYLATFLRKKTGLQKLESSCNKEKIKSLKVKLTNDGFTDGQLKNYIKQLGFLGIMGDKYKIFQALQSKYHEFGQDLQKEGFAQQLLNDYNFSDDREDCYTSIRNVLKIYFENPYDYQRKLIYAFEKQSSHQFEEHQWEELIMKINKLFNKKEFKIFDKFKQQKLIEIFSIKQSSNKQPSISSTQKSINQPRVTLDKSNDETQKTQKLQSKLKLDAITFENKDNKGNAQQITQTGPNAQSITEFTNQKTVTYHVTKHYQGDIVYQGVADDNEEIRDYRRNQQERDDFEKHSERGDHQIYDDHSDRGGNSIYDDHSEIDDCQSGQ